IARDRFHEPAHRVRILALYALGRQHEALDAYTRCRRLLDEELGLEPMPETRALQKAILGQVDPASLIPPPTLSYPPAPQVLVGRRRELDQLERAARAALHGQAAVLLVQGEPRIGKTTTLDALAARLPAVHVGRARCTAAEQSLAYVPLVAALSDALGSEIALDEHALHITSLEALASVVREHAPLVLVLDELQHADAPTVAAIV